MRALMCTQILGHRLLGLFGCRRLLSHATQRRTCDCDVQGMPPSGQDIICIINNKGIRPAQCRATAGSADAATNWPSALVQMSAAAPPAPASSRPRHPPPASWAPPRPASSRSPGTKSLRMSVRVCVRGCSTERDRHAMWHGTAWHSTATTCDVRCCAGRVRDRYVLWRAPGYQGAALSRRRCGR